MGDLLIRGIPDDEMQFLKEVAKDDGRSMQAQAKALILEALERRRAHHDLVTFAERMRRESGPQRSDSTELIREDRDR